jgi:ABC-type nitrate/sulfonate/bicarbonate transport system ATPase subunit
MQSSSSVIQTEVGITFVHVTHDQEEAMTMADTGRGHALGTTGRPHRAAGGEYAVRSRGGAVRARPDVRLVPTAFVASNFLGQSNLADVVAGRG